MTDKEWRDAWLRGCALRFWQGPEHKLHFYSAMSDGAVNPPDFAMCQCGHRARFHLNKAPFCLLAGCNCRGFVAAEEMVV